MVLPQSCCPVGPPCHQAAVPLPSCLMAFTGTSAASQVKPGGLWLAVRIFTTQPHAAPLASAGICPLGPGQRVGAQGPGTRAALGLTACWRNQTEPSLQSRAPALTQEFGGLGSPCHFLCRRGGLLAC